MMRNSHNIDVSEELIIQRWKSGVRLIRPDDFYHQQHPETCPPPSVKSLFQMPFNVYFLNLQSVIQNMSDTTAYICGFQEKKDAIGNTARAVSKKESAEFSINHNNEVIAKNSVIIKDEHFMRLDDLEFRDMAIKFPLLNADEKIIGIFGCSIILDSPAQSLNLLLNTGLLGPSNLFDMHRNYFPLSGNKNDSKTDINELRKTLSVKSKQFFSKRECECLFYLMRGKSARETGIQIHISQRTVEFYLNSLKDKFNCKKKSEIIEKVLSLLKN